MIPSKRNGSGGVVGSDVEDVEVNGDGDGDEGASEIVDGGGDSGDWRGVGRESIAELDDDVTFDRVGEGGADVGIETGVSSRDDVGDVADEDGGDKVEGGVSDEIDGDGDAVDVNDESGGVGDCCWGGDCCCGCEGC